MFLYKENQVLSELNDGNNFEYVINKEQDFSVTDYKVLKNQENDIFVKCMKIKRNGKRSLYYLSEGYLKFSDLSTLQKADVMTGIVRSLCTNVLFVKNNGFLSEEKIDIDFDKIFIDRDNITVKLVYLPLNSKQFDTDFEMETELRNRLVKFLSCSDLKGDIKIQELIETLSDGTKSLSDVINKASGRADVFAQNSMNQNNIDMMQNFAGQGNAGSFGGSFGNLAAQPVNGMSGNLGANNEFSGNGLRLVGSGYEIHLDKPSLTIGKKQGMCDFVISNNNAISRRHCTIFFENGQCLIKDEGSSNGTFVNGMRLNPMQPMAIHQGDLVRLSNMDFKVY